MEAKRGSLRVKCSRVHPNSWNPNHMEEVAYRKLKRSLERALEQGTDIPPIIVRPHPKRAGYEIIDGFHRHRALGELGQPRIQVFCIDATEKDARILTNQFNYLRGQPDRQKYGAGMVKLLEMGATTQELSEVFPETVDDLQQLLEESEVSLEALKTLHGEDSDALEKLEEGSEAEEAMVELKFRVSVEQAEIIEMELSRIGSRLRGKNLRGRSLEFMAAQSAGTPIGDEA